MRLNEELAAPPLPDQTFQNVDHKILARRGFHIAAELAHFAMLPEEAQLEDSRFYLA